MATPKSSAVASTTPIHGGDFEDENMNGNLRSPWKGSTWKNYALAVCGEFIGTFLFLFFAFGGTQAAKIVSDKGTTPYNPRAAVPSPQLFLYISICFGFSLTANVWVFYRVSGGLFNPAITLGCVSAGAIPPLKGGLMAISQLVGGIAASALIQGLTPGELAVGTALAPGVNIAQGLFIEVFLTAQLMITIFLLAVEKHRATFVAPIGIGLSFFITQLFGIYYTGGSLNPARSFGPAVATGIFPGYHWIYWVGPGLGALLGAAVYRFLLFAEYQTVNPGQDDDGLPIVRCDSRSRNKQHDENSRLGGAGPSVTASRGDGDIV